jgi:uncharacterized protein
MLSLRRLKRKKRRLKSSFSVRRKERLLKQIFLYGFRALVIGIFAFFSPALVCAEEALTVPSPLQNITRQEINQVPSTPHGHDIYINDFGQLLTPADTLLLQRQLQALDESGLAQVSILTLPNTTRELAEFGPEIMNVWGIQHHGRKDGLLLLVNASRVRSGKSRGRIFVATGYRLEGVLPDAKVGRILDNTALPAFAEGDFSQGLTRAALSLVEVLRQSPELRQNKASARSDSPDWVSVFSLVFVILMVTNWFNKRRRLGGGFADDVPFGGGGYYGGFGGSDGGGFEGGFGGGSDSSGGGGAER